VNDLDGSYFGEFEDKLKILPLEGTKQQMIFEAQNTKQKFYQQAKLAYANAPNKKDELVKFYETCEEVKVVPLPIFSKV
jgi:hypothetical protein